MRSQDCTKSSCCCCSPVVVIQQRHSALFFHTISGTYELSSTTSPQNANRSAGRSSSNGPRAQTMDGPSLCMEATIVQGLHSALRRCRELGGKSPKQNLPIGSGLCRHENEVLCDNCPIKFDQRLGDQLCPGIKKQLCLPGQN